MFTASSEIKYLATKELLSMSTKHFEQMFLFLPKQALPP